jgi:hypothetical protein
VLFSDASTANFLNRNFECTWQSVRPVPTLTLDLGNGKVIKRTMHGNIATYVCTSDGVVVDILPGMYTPDEYVANLKTLAKTARDVEGSYYQKAKLATYHHDKVSKLEAAMRSDSNVAIALVRTNRRRSIPKSVTNAGLTDLLSIDTTLNDVERRDMIHRYLADGKLFRPNQIKNWLYREVLHADLDDPYLGLGPLLSSNNPFDEQ